MQTLLVIDDEASICKAFERAFTSDTISVLTAKTGIEGEQLFLEAKPDVVVIDLSLPDRKINNASRIEPRLVCRSSMMIISTIGVMMASRLLADCRFSKSPPHFTSYPGANSTFSATAF